MLRKHAPTGSGGELYRVKVSFSFVGSQKIVTKCEKTRARAVGTSFRDTEVNIKKKKNFFESE